MRRKLIFLILLIIIFSFLVIVVLKFRHTILTALNHLNHYSGAYNFIVLTISAVLIVWQIISQNIWNKKRTSLELINQIFKGDMLKIKKEVDKFINSPNFQNETYKDLIRSISSEEEKEKLVENLRIYLSYLEGIALGIRYKVYDEKMLYDYIEPIITQLTRWAKPFIDEKRRQFGDDAIYVELENLSKKWKKD